MIKELSKVQLNSFKKAEWPLVLIKTPVAATSPSNALHYRTQALKTTKLVIEFLEIAPLLHLAEVLSGYFIELQQVIGT